MLATESKRIFKDSLIIFIVLAAIITGIKASDQDVYLAPALEIFLLLFASFTGWSLFERERQENATEYMLSLPLSRNRLLLLKFLPRLLSVSLILLIYLRLHQSWQLPSFLTPFDFSVLYAGFFLLSIAFSVSFKNFVSAFFTVCLLSIGQILLILLLDQGREIGQAVLQANLTVLVFPLFFFILFQRYDIKPVSYFNRIFLPGLLVLTGLIAGLLFFNASGKWTNLFLTSKGQLLKNSCRLSEITLENGRRRFPSCLVALRETADGGILYGLTRKPGGNGSCVATSLVALDLKSGELKTIFPFANGWTVAAGYSGEIGAERDGTYSLLLLNPKLKKTMLLQVRNGQVRKFPVAGNFFDPHISYVFYLNGTPTQLVIFSESRLYRLDLSGRVTELAQAQSFNVWQDKIVLFESSAMSLYQVGKELTLLLQRKGKFKKSRRIISGYESRSVIYHAGRDYFWLDLEQQRENQLEVKSPPYTYQQSGENFNVVFNDGTVFTIREIRSGKQSETVWAPGFQPKGIRISPYGLLVLRDGKFKVFPFNR